MSEYTETLLTDEGLQLARRASAGLAKFWITRVVASTTVQTADQLRQSTELPDIMQSGDLRNISGESDYAILAFEAIFNNAKLKAGYSINTIGIFAEEEGTNNEIFYAFTRAKDAESAEYMPVPTDENVKFRFTINLYLAVGRTANVTINVADTIALVAERNETGFTLMLDNDEYVGTSGVSLMDRTFWNNKVTTVDNVDKENLTITRKKV